jgi:DNA-binding response OmpR family regulator
MKKKILIIDDEVDFCLIMKGYFNRKNYEVFVAYNLQSGLFLIDENKPDILFLDNNLAGWARLEICRPDCRKKSPFRDLFGKCASV